MFTRVRRRGLAALALVALLPLASACDDDPIDEHGEEPEFMELTVGGQTFRVSSNGTVVAGTVPSILVGAGIAVTARFLADDGDILDLDTSEFELRATSRTPAVLSWASTGAFSGTLTGVAAGTVLVDFSLFHLDENHEDWGPHNVTFTVVAP